MSLCISNLLFTVTVVVFHATVLLLRCEVTCYSETIDTGYHSDSREIFDLGYWQDENTLFFPGQRFKNFELYKSTEGFTFTSPEQQRYFFASFSFCQSEHGGTHLDAPYHFNQNGWKIGEIPPNRMVGVPLVVVDVMEDVFSLPFPADFKVEVEHLLRHERQYGKIPSESIIFVRTGWSRFWPNFDEYFGMINGTSNFPGYSVEAANWLVDNRNVIAVGIDTASVDIGNVQGGNYAIHILLTAKQVYLIENLANLDYLLKKIRPRYNSSTENHKLSSSKCDLRVIILPIKSQGTGGPARVMAYCKS